MTSTRFQIQFFVISLEKLSNQFCPSQSCNTGAFSCERGSNIIEERRVPNSSRGFGKSLTSFDEFEQSAHGNSWYTNWIPIELKSLDGYHEIVLEASFHYEATDENPDEYRDRSRVGIWTVVKDAPMVASIASQSDSYSHGNQENVQILLNEWRFGKFPNCIYVFKHDATHKSLTRCLCNSIFPCERWSKCWKPAHFDVERNGKRRVILRYGRFQRNSFQIGSKMHPKYKTVAFYNCSLKWAHFNSMEAGIPLSQTTLYNSCIEESNQGS